MSGYFFEVKDAWLPTQRLKEVTVATDEMVRKMIFTNEEKTRGRIFFAHTEYFKLFEKVEYINFYRSENVFFLETTVIMHFVHLEILMKEMLGDQTIVKVVKIPLLTGENIPLFTDTKVKNCKFEMLSYEAVLQLEDESMKMLSLYGNGYVGYSMTLEEGKVEEILTVALEATKFYMNHGVSLDEQKDGKKSSRKS